VIDVRLLDRDRFRRRVRVEVDNIPFRSVTSSGCRADEFFGNEVIVVGAKGRLRNSCRGRLREELVGNAVVVRNAVAPHFHPQIVSAACGDDGEMFAGKLGNRRQLVLHGAELVERAVRFRRQQLLDDSVDRVKRQTAAGEIDLPGRRHDVRLVAGVHDQRFAVDAYDRLEQGGDETHFSYVGRLRADH